MAVFLINPSDHSFGTAVITPRWLYVLAAATPLSYGDPVIVDETLEALVPSTIQSGDFVGIGIHTGNALRGYEVGRLARERGAWVVYGGIHATLYPEEALERGHAHAVVKGDGDVIWSKVLQACMQGSPDKLYEAIKRFFANAASAAAFERPELRATFATVSTHWLRHTFGLHSIANGMALATARNFLGHKDVATTSVYSTEEIAQQYRELDVFLMESTLQDPSRALEVEIAQGRPKRSNGSHPNLDTRNLIGVDAQT